MHVAYAHLWLTHFIIYLIYAFPLHNIIAERPRSSKIKNDDAAKDCHVTWHQPRNACSHMRGKHILRIYKVVYNEKDNERNLALLILRIIVYKAKKCQVIATILINNKLTYANEANEGSEELRSRRNFNVIAKARREVRWNVR